jgi:SsrA-binding protein
VSKANGKKDGPPVIQNRAAYHEYFIEDELECGIVLAGHEVKMIRRGAFQLKDAYCDIENGELWLVNSHIPEYAQASSHVGTINPLGRRKLLVHREELRKLRRKKIEKGMTIIPLKAYFVRGNVKLLIGLAKGKKHYDKRETIKQRDIQMEMVRGGRS